MATGFVSLWLIPIMASLFLAVPLSWMSGVDLPGSLSTPQEVRAPLVAKRAAQWRAKLKSSVEGSPAQ